MNSVHLVLVGRSLRSAEKSVVLLFVKLLNIQILQKKVNYFNSIINFLQMNEFFRFNEYSAKCLLCCAKRWLYKCFLYSRLLQKENSKSRSGQVSHELCLIWFNFIFIFSGIASTIYSHRSSLVMISLIVILIAIGIKYS